MDPVSAIGLASAVLSFVTFAWDLVAGAGEIYHSLDGTLDEHAHLENVISDLNLVVDELGKRVASANRHERAISQLAQQCRDEADSLIDIFQKLKKPGKRTAWRSLRTAWMAMAVKDDIVKLKERLQEYRFEILLNLALLLRYEQSGFGNLLRSIEDDCKELKISTEDGLQGLKQEIIQVAQTAQESYTLEQKTAEELLAATQEAERQVRNVLGMLTKLQKMVQEAPIQHRVLRQLVFEGMRSRRTQIVNAKSSTWGWMVDPSLSETAASDFNWNSTISKEEEIRLEAGKAFRDWLRNGQHIFHISGNAGSGKSTLMKTLANHPNTKDELAKWAGSRSIVVAEFYFWRSGTTLQMTVQGLYRSLLFEILSQCPELTATVFPRQWKLLTSGRGDRVVESLNFENEAIEEAFGLFVRDSRLTTHRFCFFIDGLDEIPGDALAQEKLSEILRSWVEGRNIKICASSRPYREYLKLLSYPENPTLHLHMLNRVDIKNYCHDRFYNDREIACSEDSFDDLVGEVVDNAQGVFLWAYLVVDILLVAFRNGHSRQALFTKLREIPTELDHLYDNLRALVGMSRSDRQLSNQMLLLAVRNPFEEPLNAIAFSWLEGPQGLEDPTFPTNHLEPYSEKEIERRLEQAMKRISGLAQGFLEVVYFEPFVSYLGRASFHASKVQFSHRSARDYLLESSDRMEALQTSFPGFMMMDVYGRMSLAEYIFGFGDIDEVHPGHLSITFALWLRDIRDIDSEKSLDILRNFQDVYLTRAQTLGLFTHHPTPLTLYRLVEYYSIWHYWSGPASFIHFAAHSGLNEFVLDQLGLRPELYRTSGNLSLLVAALDGEQTELALTLLESGVILDDMFTIERFDHLPNKDEHCISMWPLWIIASIVIIDQICAWRYMHRQNPDQMTLLLQLVRHGRKNAEAASASFEFMIKPASLLINSSVGIDTQEVPLEALLIFLEAGLVDHSSAGSESEGLLGPLMTEPKTGFLLAQNSRWDRKLLSVSWRGQCFDTKQDWFRVY